MIVIFDLGIDKTWFLFKIAILELEANSPNINSFVSFQIILPIVDVVNRLIENEIYQVIVDIYVLRIILQR